MASHMSHFSPSSRQETPPSSTHRGLSTRQPSKPTILALSQSGIPTLQASRLARKRVSNDSVVLEGSRMSRTQTPTAPKTTKAEVLGPESLRVTTLQSHGPPSTITIPRSPAARHAENWASATPRTPYVVPEHWGSASNSPKMNTLRRKSSSIDRYPTRRRKDYTPSFDDHRTLAGMSELGKTCMPGMVLGITLPLPNSVSSPPLPLEGDHSPPVPEEPSLLRYLPPPALPYTHPGSPSTRYSESPGVFSHTSTPTSMSSYSPRVVMSSNPGSRTWQTSPSESRPLAVRKEATPSQHVSLLEPQVPLLFRDLSTSTVGRSSGGGKHMSLEKRLPAPPSSVGLRNRSIIRKLVPVSESSINTATIKETVLPSQPTSQVQIPPELAHLNVDLLAKPDRSKLCTARPVRPSRDGTSSLTDQREPSPIVQSNLPLLYTTFHKRQPSVTTPTSAMSPGRSCRSRFGFGSRGSSRNPSPSPSLQSTFSPPPFTHATATGRRPDTPSDDEKSALRRTAASPSRATSRFGFLTRKAKTESSMSMKKTEKKPRKGPMAGTGHEGYGRLPFRGRKVSTISAGSLGRCASAGSATESVLETSSTRDSSVYREDKFTVNRLDVEGVNPTVTRSGYNASDGSSLLPNRLSVGYKMNSPDELSTNSSLGNDTGWSTSLPAATPGRGPSSLATIRPARSCGRSFDRGDKTTPVQPPTLAIGRPVHRAQPFHDKELPRLLTPTGELPPLSSSSINDTTRPTLPYTTPTKGFHERVEGNWEMSGKNTKPQSKPSRMFNFFQRAQKSPKHEIKPEHPAINVQVTVTHQPPSRSIAHYAMLDSDERVDLGYLERIMQDTETLRGDGVATGEESVSEKAPSLRPRERRRNGVLPSASVRHKAHTHMPRPSSPKPLLPQGEPSMNNVPAPASNLRRHDFPEASVTSSLRSRLSPVGRIPRVVSKRDRDRKLPDVSFSRPFARAQPRPIVQPPGALYTAIREAASPSEPASVTTASSDAARSYSDESSTVRHVDTKPRATNSFDGVDGVNAGTSIEFISFSPRHNSDMSYSSNSSTAIVPAAGAPLSEDEIWHEYNDLIDDVLPAGTLKPAGPSLEASSRYANLTSKRSDVRQSSALPRSDSLLSRQSSTRSTDLFSITRSSTVPAVTRTPSYGSSTLPPLALPNPSLSVIETHNDYGEPNDFGSARTSIRKSLPPVTCISSGSIRSSLHPSLRRTSGSAHSRSTSVPEASSVRSSTNNAGLGVSQTYFRDTQLMNIAEIETGNDGDSMANLRLGALMTSKWLSFGRVLFSPAHVEVKSNKAERVLVVDGLGKDWSYFCALTYPEAIVYSLGPNHINEPSSLPIADQSVWHSLPNHRHVHHANVAAPFPFSRGFFAAVVFRFPLASTDAVLQTAVSECKRVLRPGGYLEVSVLDLDMLNMGNRARRAVRGLKMRMQEMDPDISLKPASDNIQKMLGRRGFENLNRCVVGVPVAGHIPGSRDMDTATTGVRDGDDNEKDNNLSFADLLKDQSSGNNDENITKMIARVGRWWYSQCHETGVLTTARNRNTSASIWADEALLRECEKRGTSFRLLISYAQKPTATMRRTVSV